MKKFVINFFRKFPACTGLLLLLIALHLTGSKSLRTPMVIMHENLWVIFSFYCVAIIIFMLHVLPKLEHQKKEKTTWRFIAVCVAFLTVLAKILV